MVLRCVGLCARAGMVKSCVVLVLRGVGSVRGTNKRAGVPVVLPSYSWCVMVPPDCGFNIHAGPLCGRLHTGLPKRLQERENIAVVLRAGYGVPCCSRCTHCCVAQARPFEWVLLLHVLCAPVAGQLNEHMLVATPCMHSQVTRVGGCSTAVCSIMQGSGQRRL